MGVRVSLGLAISLLAPIGCDDEPGGGSGDVADATGDLTQDTAPDAPVGDVADSGDGEGTGGAEPGEILWTRDFDQRFTNITFPSFGPNGEMIVLAVGFGADIEEPTVVHRIDPATGTSLWDDDTLLSIGGGPCVISPSGTCWVTDIATGAQRLVGISMDGDIVTDIALPNGENPHVEGIHGDAIVLTQTWFVGIQAFDQAEEGPAEWTEADIDAANKRVLAIRADGTALISEFGLGIYARDAAGQAGWSAEFDGPTCEWLWEASVLLADGTLVTGCNNAMGGGHLWRLDADGQDQGAVLVPNISALAVAADGDLLVGTAAGLSKRDPTGEDVRWDAWENGQVYGLTAGDSGHTYGLAISVGEYHIFVIDADGELAWEYVPEEVQFTGWPTLGPDGTLYVSVYYIDGGRQLVALATDSGGLADSPWPTFNHDLARTRQGD